MERCDKVINPTSGYVPLPLSERSFYIDFGKIVGMRSFHAW